VRSAVRGFLERERAAGGLESGQLAVAVSGGADSLALAALAIPLAAKLDVRVTALLVDHQLQDNSAQVARKAAAAVLEFGAVEAKILPVVVDGPGGIEAAARAARYAALREALPANVLCLLGHTQDDQAETVLLGLGRGSGPRSIAGMRAVEGPWGRPLLGVSRSDTERTCAALGLRPWADPHNLDAKFTRVRLRSEVLPLLEDVLNGGVKAALARTADQLRDDNDLLDDLAARLLAEARSDNGLAVSILESAPTALRRRALRSWLAVGDLTALHLRSVDELVTRWHGQGPISLPGSFAVRRTRGQLVMLAAHDIETA
jgi:tRNA(Ile)-lysidine synthase